MNHPEGTLPKGWVCVALAEVLESIEAGANFRCVERPPSDGETGVAKISAVSWGRFDELESKTCPEHLEIDPRTLIREGDFLISRANTVRLVGACVIVDRIGKRLALSDKVLRLRIVGALPKWILYCLRSPMGRAQIESLATGNQESMRNIGQDRIRSIRIPLPSVTEQRRIIAAIEEQFSRLDAAVASLQRARANMKRYRAGVLAAAIEAKLVVPESKLAKALGRSYESADQLLARIGGKNGSPTPSVVTMPTTSRSLPQGWVWTTVGYLADVATGATPLRGRADYYTNGTVPFVTSSATGGQYVDSANQSITERALRETNAKVFPAGTLLVAMYGEGKTRERYLLWLVQSIDLAGLPRTPQRVLDLLEPNKLLSLLRELRSPDAARLSTQIHGLGQFEREGVAGFRARFGLVVEGITGQNLGPRTDSRGRDSSRTNGALQP